MVLPPALGTSLARSQPHSSWRCLLAGATSELVIKIYYFNAYVRSDTQDAFERRIKTYYPEND